MKGLGGQTIGKYELVREIGEGNMGTVYLGRDPFSLREVAVKIASPKGTENERTARRRRKLFFNECKAAGMLRHPNIVATIDAGIDDGRRYIVMEFVPGAHTLDVYCDRDNLLPVTHVVSLVLKCAIAFDYAHNKGVVHRDIKPKNIMMTQDNEVKICDFGVALIDNAEVEETQVMGTLGSPRYMSPEQVMSEVVTNQSDIFSLGVMTYELLCGVHPFHDRTIPAIARRIAREPHVPVHRLRRDVPVELTRIIDRTLKKHPAGRYRTAMDFAGDLSLIYDDLNLSVQGVSTSDRFHQVRSLSFFKDFEESDVLEVVNAGVWQQFTPGAEIIVEGEYGDAFYILVEGEVLVRRGAATVDVLKPGASFGEIGFINRQERTASIVARTDVQAIKVRAALVERTSINCQLRFQKSFLRTMAERLSRTMRYIDQEMR